MQSPTRYRWMIVAVVFVSTVIGIMAWAAAFPLLNLWVRELGISRTQGGLLTGLFYVPGIFIALPGSRIFHRYPLRRVFLLCWLAIASGIALMAGAPDFTVLCAGRLLFALGMNLHLVGAPKMLAMWFEGRDELGLVMAVYSVGVSLGVYGGMNVAGHFGQTSGWRAAMILLAALTLTGLLLMALLRQPPVTSVADEAAPLSFARAGGTIWSLAAGYFFFNIASDSFLTFAPDYLVQRGLSLEVAAALVGSYAWAALTIKLTAAPFLKAGNAVWYVIAGCLFGVLSNILLLQSTITPRLAVVGIGVAFGLAMPALYALPAFLFSRARAGLAYGYYQLFYSLGSIVQPTVGYTIDRTGSYVWGYALLSVLFIAGLLCIWSVRAASPVAPVLSSVEPS